MLSDLAKSEGVSLAKIKENLRKTVHDSRISHAQMFSAWDVTKQVKVAKADVSHREVRGIVIGSFKASEMPQDYARTLIKLKTGRKTFIYHPVNVDPVTYYAAGVPDPVDSVDDTDND